MVPAQDANLCPLRSRFAPGRCSYNKTKPCQRTRRSTRPGCEWVPAGTLICARFVRGSHRGGAPTTKPNPASEPVGAPAPGANGGLPEALIGARFGSRFAPRRCSYKTKTYPDPVGAPAPGANGGLPVTQICARFVRGSHRGGAPTTKTTRGPVGAPAPGANGCLPAPYPVIGKPGPLHKLGVPDISTIQQQRLVHLRMQ